MLDDVISNCKGDSFLFTFGQDGLRNEVELVQVQLEQKKLNPKESIQFKYIKVKCRLPNF